MKDTETILVLQGGGSLGAYECGVFKTLHRNKIKFDVIVGTSIGAVNASIIAGTKNQDKSADKLQEFWNAISDTGTEFLPESIRTYQSVLNSTIFGTADVALPYFASLNPWLFANSKPFLYDNSPLKKILKKYVDFEFLNKKKHSRLLVTSVDIQKGEPVIFDSLKKNLDIDHIIASTGYPFYGINWTKKDGAYLWDGSLMSNTPFREAINASPIKDKIVYLVSLFPKVHNALPKNMGESWHRARDIMYSDKTEHNMTMSKIISRYLDLLKKMYSMLERSELDNELKQEFQKINSEYTSLVAKRGAIIQKMIKIERTEESHFLFEDVDFSKKTISSLIDQGSRDAAQVLKKHQ